MNSSLIISLVAYCFLFWLHRYAAARKADKIIDMLQSNGNERILLQKQSAGITVLLVAAIAWLPFHPEGYRLLMLPVTGNWIYAWLAVTVSSLIISSRHTFAATRKHQTHFDHPIQPAVFLWYFSGRIAFLFLYEFFLRGILLFGIASFTGVIVSVCINILLYAGLHVSSSREELVATIPFGIAACCLSIASDSVIPVAVLHIIISFTNEFIITGSVNRSLKLHTA